MADVMMVPRGCLLGWEVWRYETVTGEDTLPFRRENEQRQPVGGGRGAIPDRVMP